MTDFGEEEEEGVPITKKALKALIRKHNLYSTPSLNEVLYLHHQGFTQIRNLDKYVNLKALWLNNNAISKIEGLEQLVNLKCLYLASNIIESMSGLEALVALDTLSLSHNYIRRIEGLQNCKCLTTLELDHNKFGDPDGLAGVMEVADSLTILNLNNNDIEDERFAEVIKGLTKLRVLRMVGNEVTRKMRDYRRRLILQFEDLRFLDDAPVEDDERRCVTAWGQGGREAEKAERQKIKSEKDALHQENMRKFRELTGRPAKVEEVEPQQPDSREEQEKEKPFFVTEQTKHEEEDTRDDVEDVD